MHYCFIRLPFTLLKDPRPCGNMTLLLKRTNNWINQLRYFNNVNSMATFFEFNKSSKAASLQHLELCIDGIKSWMSQNILKLNEDKTEVIVFGSRKYLEGMPSISIRVGDCTITSTRSVRNLGAHFDSQMNMEEFIIKKCRACRLQLHKIARIRKYLSNDTCSCIIQGLVTSKLDYANCLPYGVNKVILHRLQIVQNSAARVILKMRKYDHISRARQELVTC